MFNKNRIFITVFIIAISFCVFSCSKSTNDSIENPTLNTTQLGFNMRWRDTPKISEELSVAILGMKPDLLRYPGGTLAHKWNWKTGLPTPNNPNDVVHLIGDVKKMTDATNTGVVFVLDIVNSSVSNQLEMLMASNVAIEYIEIGNELYSDHYEEIFPTGKSYADTVNSWVPQVRRVFPNAKFGACMLGRTTGNDRKRTWNTQVSENINVPIDAYIYHIYVSEDETVHSRIERFEEHFIENSGKETWITEYGAHSHTIEQTNEISDYVESIADIALNHCLIAASGNFSKIDSNSDLTEEGQLFVNRNKNK
jgi:hypothetical protein